MHLNTMLSLNKTNLNSALKINTVKTRIKLRSLVK